MENLTLNSLNAEILTASHALIGGATGAGKTTLLNNILADIVRLDYQFSVIDLKKISLDYWRDAPQLLYYATQPDEATALLNHFKSEIDKRYALLQGDKSIAFKPYYLIIDEGAELLDTDLGGKANKALLKSILRLGRQCACKVIFATQSVNRKTIPADLALNFEALVALRCRSAIESKQVVGVAGAELLPRYGECLIYTPSLLRVHKAQIPVKELPVFNHIRQHHRTQVRDHATEKTIIVKRWFSKVCKISYILTL